MKMDTLDKRIINELSKGVPLSLKPYQVLAKKLGIEEKELLRKINDYKKKGLIRRLGAILNHYSIGLTANVMVVWKVPQDRASEIGKIMASFPEVTHCYERVTYPEFPYNLYTMIHTKSKKECEELANKISKKTGITDYKLLYTVKELKKRNMKYYNLNSDTRYET